MGKCFGCKQCGFRLYSVLPLLWSMLLEVLGRCNSVLDNAYYGLKLVNCKISWIGLRVAIFGLLMYFYSEYPPRACSICINV